MSVAAVCLGLAVSTAGADTLRITDGTAGNGPGGQFKIDNVTGFAGLFDLTGTSFQTFCVERNEYISLGSTYEYEIATSAIAGGVGGGNPDPLSPEAAFLYSMFRKGTLDDLVAGYSYGDNSDADELQEAIWYLEDEVDSHNGLASDLVAAALASGWTDIGNVRVLRLFTLSDTGDNQQDQLTIIPLPAPVGMAMAGLFGMGVISRRRRS
ncbi:MAG: VPLPA-CTERM sorting domain-containing protein [Phycisphaerales bacterium]